MPIWVWVIEHTDGAYIVDTGANPTVNNSVYFKSSGMFSNWFNNKMFRFSFDKEQGNDMQLFKIGIYPSDTKAVVLTHLHLDHIDGVGHFPEAKIMVSKLEWESPYGAFPKLYPKWLKPELFELNEKYQNFDNAFYLTHSKDLVAIHTPGHTPGSNSMVLKTDDFDIVFAGDICYHQDQLIGNMY